LASVYPHYRVCPFTGGYSNGYIVMVKSFEALQVCSQGSLHGLNRDLIAVEAAGVNGYTGYVFLAHFKSGQTGLTKSQLKSCTALGGNWVATGDLNMEYQKCRATRYSRARIRMLGRSTDPKQRAEILDWVLASVDVQVVPVDITHLDTVFDMSGPDHRPILFDVRT